MALAGVQLSLDELGALGVKRVSVGSALARAAYGAFLKAAHEIRDHGTFTFAEQAAAYADMNAMFKVPDAGKGLAVMTAALVKRTAASGRKRLSEDRRIAVPKRAVLRSELPS